MTYKILSIGQDKNSPYTAMCEEYIKRLAGKLHLTELNAKHQKNPAQLNKQENLLLKENIPDNAFVIALDSKGKSFSSQAFAQKLQQLKSESFKHIIFIIGGSDGLDETIKKQANLLLSFGPNTWPHMLARVMLMEQIYRAEQIIAGHPYHK